MSDGHHPLCSKLRRAPECGCWERAAVATTSAMLGGYSLDIQSEIIRSDFSHVSPEDVAIFRDAIASSREQKP
jgi:hypothetical protein